MQRKGNKPKVDQKKSNTYDTEQQQEYDENEATKESETINREDSQVDPEQLKELYKQAQEQASKEAAFFRHRKPFSKFTPQDLYDQEANEKSLAALMFLISSTIGYLDIIEDVIDEGELNKEIK